MELKSSWYITYIHTSYGDVHRTAMYIADMLTPVSSVQSLSTQRSAANGDYIVPHTHRKLGGGLSPSPHLKLGTGCRPNWKRQPVPLTVSNALSKHFYFNLPTAVKHVLA